MTNDEIPNDERNPNAEARMTKTGSAGVAVMADMGGKGRTFNIQLSTLNVQRPVVPMLL
jgi:hypothetical protein